MTRMTMVALAGILVAGTALAQDGRRVPVEQDLRRWDRLENRLEATGSIRPADPGGLSERGQGVSQPPGLPPPPGTIGDSVMSYGPLPPGAPGNEQW